MEYCYNCEIPESRALLFDVVLPDKVEKICRKCSFREESPVIKTLVDVPKIEKKPSVYQRLSKMSGVDVKKEEKNENLLKEEKRLSEIVNRNFRRNVGTTDLREELIDNFHWIVMRARRNSHLTQKQVAEKLRESEIAIRMLERGVVNDINLIGKVEEFFSIKIRKNSSSEQDHNPESENLDFNKFKNLKLHEIQEIKEQKENEIFSSFPEESQEKESEMFENSDEEPD